MEKFSVKKPFTILVAVIMVLLLGFVSITNLQTNLLPDISTPYLMVVTVYPGASPERVESEVSDVMENALGTVSGVESITATSAENYSLLLMKFAEGTDMNSAMVKIGLYLTAILLVVADMLPEGEKTQKNLKPKDALIAGFFQGFSTIPGLSRLGSTISACVIGGMTRSYAVKYSLIVSVPAIIGATIVEIATMGKNKIVFHPVYLVGVFMAALAGYFTIRILMRVVKKRKLKYFALYCLLVGTFSIAGYFLL